MQIQIKNIGKIKKANINLDGLSVIAGNNDTGKSTISKVVFSVIKAFQRYEEFSEKSKEKIIKKYSEDLYLNLRKNFNSDKNKFKVLKSTFEPEEFLKDLLESKDKKIFFKLRKSFLLSQIKDEKIFKLLENIEKEYFKTETKESLIETALEEIFYEEFKFGFKCNDLKGEIIFREGNLLLFKINISNTSFKVEIRDDLLKIKEITFINSPIVLEFINNLSFGNILYHYKDLLEKIKNPKLNIRKDIEKNIKEISIDDIIKGKFEFINDGYYSKELKFIKDGLVNPVEVINTATGIKTFGILDLLDKSNCLDGDDLLILDEPEVHLHPEWQVEYAKLIIKLIKERDLSVLITSHSPYMIEALSKFSKEKEVKASFYLSEEDGKGKCVINDKTKKKYEIFEKLSKPFRDLMLK